MKILIVGCNGLLGQNLLRTLPREGLPQLVGIGQESECFHGNALSAYVQADISDRDSLARAFDALAPDWIVNAAAITNVDLCETERDLCRRVNLDAVAWMAKTGIPMAHVSTDYVFDGESGPYKEEDPTSPVNYYGQIKLESEKKTLSGSPRSLVVRTITLWGRGKGMKPSFVDFVKSNLEQGKTIKVVTDQWGNPTLAEDLAVGIWTLIRKGHSGLFHVCGSEWNSRMDWARQIADYYGLDTGLIVPCLTADLGQKAARPLRSGLKTDKLVAATGFRPGGVKEQLLRAGET